MVWGGVPVTIPGMTRGTIRGITDMAAAGTVGTIPGITTGGTRPGLMAGTVPGTTAGGTHPGIMVDGTILGITVDIGVAVIIKVLTTDITVA